MIHPAAASGFGVDAERYHRARPGYPDEIVDRIAEVAEGPILDLAAGTGKLTLPMLTRGLDVVAIEPVGAMRDVLVDRTGLRKVAGGVAEALPFAASSFSLVTVAQAFHWFDAPRAWVELTRIVRPGGHVAVVWNARSRHTAWQERVWNLLDELEETAPYRATAFEAPPPPWNRVGLFECPHDVPTTVELLKERIASVSVVATLDAASRAEIDRRVEEIVADLDDPMTLRYDARLFFYQSDLGLSR